MNACIFIMSINALMPVYGPDQATQVDTVSVGDSVCVTKIENGSGWMQIHWSSGNIGHTGWLKDVSVKQNAQPTEPTQREEEYNVAPPPPPPAPAPSPQMQQQRSYQQPNLDSPITRPTTFVMDCFPEGGKPYAVVYMNGDSMIGTKTGTPRRYPAIREHDDQGNHVFYVTAQRQDQERALFYAFDYSQRGEDVSSLAAQLPGQPKTHDKCVMDWKNTK